MNPEAPTSFRVKVTVEVLDLRGVVHSVLVTVINIYKHINKYPLLLPPPPQINGLALDTKSVTECESLLRSCRDSLSLSLMKVPNTC